ncbi:putative cysteine-rich receptor-like protein kinase 12 isoform X2 [Bidens hawaiensis]|uniref:putative cysteine-rich receptor-like protein kinase 12 isoform X2 n=1 Tax=Bidens hawaiensis TaxID=980011 RepID=UPI00404A55C8
MFVAPLIGENSDGSLRHHLDTIQGENYIFRRFDFNTMRVATENFSRSNKVSDQVRYISMYKGTLQNGQAIAIAETISNRFVEYMHETSILVKCEHENVIKLLGYCIEGTKVSLVFEFASNASLYHLLHDPRCTHLDWNILYKKY